MPDRTRSRRRPGRPARLARDAVLRAAVELADEAGMDAITMRAVAHRLGAEAMSLYRHVVNKEDLLDGMVDVVYAELHLPAPATPWREAMRAYAVSARTALNRHPWALQLMESRARPGPANLRHHDGIIAVLAGVGFDSATITRIYNVVDSYVYGFALQEHTVPVATPEDIAEFGTAFLQTMPADRYPHLARVGRDLIAAGFDYRAEFEVGLDLILDALGTHVTGGST